MTLVEWAIGSMLLGIVLGIATEAIVEAYRAIAVEPSPEQKPILGRWLYSFFGRIPILRDAHHCGFCWPAYVAAGGATVVAVTFPSYWACCPMSILLAFRISHFWHDMQKMVQCSKNSCM